MAVDTPRRRFAMMGFAQLGVLLPVPDGNVGDTDRLMLLGFYGGFAAGAEKVVEYIEARARKYLGVEAASRAYLGMDVGARRYLDVTVDNR